MMKQKIHSKRKLRTPKTILRLPDLDVAKSAVLNRHRQDQSRRHRSPLFAGDNSGRNRSVGTVVVTAS